MAFSWIYLLNAAILLVVFFFLFYQQEERGVPLRWFLLWLGLNAVTNVLMFCSRAIPDLTVSLSFYQMAYCSATVLVVAGFFFIRSFEGGNDFAAVLWSVPALLNLAFILVAGGTVSIYDEGVWRFDMGDRAAILPLLILTFYSVASLVYLFRLYQDIRKGTNELVRKGVVYLMVAFLVIFLTNLASPLVRDYVSPLVPLGEVGGTVGGLIVALNLSWIKARMERKQSLI